MAVADAENASQPGGTRNRPVSNFLRHFVEMIIAMLAGMAVLGGLVSLICTLLGHEDILEHVTVLALLMPTYMTVGMAAWMGYRGHKWPRIGEMAAAMYAPFLILLVPFTAGVLGGGGILAVGHVLMLVAMLAVMLLRRGEYFVDHRLHAGEVTSEPDPLTAYHAHSA